ncbi:alpha-xenorhabdolysin family binary toxin subunit A [uncultured Algoriphagus sp.]|uniref:alpha-xenorhabdolysin family binary toxin subunit A n=1 Tax=uncultured Algoriphagus sp. TaxID=417365 RepID=UPI0030EDBDED|tara:strand:- start:11085 stop:12212 length:1128 start_codon:yes stop_codon:yes gene_type:complete
MTAVLKKINIGPGAIATPSESGGPGFALSAAEWYAIQTYVIAAQSKEIMPHTEADFKAFLGSGAPGDMSPFTPLINAYKGIFDHVTTWNDDTFPASVSLASDVVSYAQQAPTYYAPILPLAQKLVDNPNDQSAKDKLKAILDTLAKSASGYQSKAEAVATKIKTFADQTQADKDILVGPDGKSGLFKKYDTEYGEKSVEVQRLTKELADQQTILDAANKEYEHDVVVAATSPTYAWVWPFGTIAAAVVAGVYGKRATDALDRAHAARAKIKELNEEKQADANLMASLHTTQMGLSGNINSISAALPVIQKIQGVWAAISDDLGNISKLIETNIAEALPIIMDLGVESAIKAWTAVGEEAQAYRVNAYVTVSQKAA